jgi:hypothetical protein
MRTVPGNFLWRTGGTETPGALLFTGLWALLLGAVFISAGGMTLFRLRLGGAIALVAGVIGLCISITNIVMLVTKYTNIIIASEGKISTGFGPYLFVGSTALGLILGIVTTVVGLRLRPNGQLVYPA